MARGQNNITARNPLSLKVHPVAWMRISISYMDFKTQTIPASSLKGNSLSQNPARCRDQEQGTQRGLTHTAPPAEQGHLPFQLLCKHHRHQQRTVDSATSRWDVKSPGPLTHNHQKVANGALLLQSLFNTCSKTVRAQLKIIKKSNWDYCWGRGWRNERRGEKENQISYLVTPPEDVWEKNKKDATSEAQEILGNWSGKYKNLQPIQDSWTWRGMKFAPL